MSSTNRHRLVRLFLFAVAWLQCIEVRAQTAPEVRSGDRVSGQALFDRGKERLLAGDYAVACPLFEESHHLAPGIGVLLHLGLCLERSSKNADAWAAFQEAADRAHAEGDVEREQIARERVRQLFGKLAFLTIRVRRGASELQLDSARSVGLVMRRNGVSVPIAALGIEFPVDPGTHRVEVALSPAHRAARAIDLAGGQHATLELSFAESAGSTSQQQLPSSVIASAHGGRSKANSASNPWDLAAWATAGVGSAGLLVGAVSGALAYSKMQDARTLCAGRETNDCPPESIRIQDSARAPATVATISAIVGAACLTAAGIYWSLIKTERAELVASVGPRVSHLSLATHW